MAWIAVDSDGEELITDKRPKRGKHMWRVCDCDCVSVPKGSAEKLTGEPMAWNDSPRELK